MKKAFINFLAFQIAWLVTVLAAAKGSQIIGPIVVFIWILAYWIWQPKARKDFPLLISIGFVGLIADSFLTLIGAISFVHQPLFHAPTTAWMIALWINFGACIRHSMSWACGRYILLSLLGMVGGPLAYLAGQKLGAIYVHSILTVAAVWVPAMVAVIWLEKVTRIQLDT